MRPPAAGATVLSQLGTGDTATIATVGRVRCSWQSGGSTFVRLLLADGEWGHPVPIASSTSIRDHRPFAPGVEDAAPITDPVARRVTGDVPLFGVES